ncbi:5-methylcytosine-specific restriction enzyme B [Chryseobacterium carnipullorum]|uniref:5-methylcytosine-specific restriction enzyme B n=1 Tax=Chryseobacterium carnipullorum TaxID=1124835 RepID=A0A376EC80_CHRCU|nr:5-methylcytosine-specific restriction enzyme B [Chryseobacterium carnipullorum]
MNTADRSVGHIDYAIRRRFAFVDVLPKNLESELKDDFKVDLFAKVASLFIENYDVALIIRMRMW